MAKTPAITTNPRVKSATKVGNRTELELTEAFYHPLIGIDNSANYVQYEAKVAKYEESIASLRNRQPAPITSLTSYADTIKDMHNEVNRMVDIAGWEASREALIAKIQGRITEEQKRIAERDRERRETAFYKPFTEAWQNTLIHTDESILGGLDDWCIRPIATNQAKAVSKCTTNVTEWRDKELERLRMVLAKVTQSITEVEAVNPEEAQAWLSRLSHDASEYITNGKE